MHKPLARNKTPGAPPHPPGREPPSKKCVKGCTNLCAEGDSRGEAGARTRQRLWLG